MLQSIKNFDFFGFDEYKCVEEKQIKKKYGDIKLPYSIG